MKINDILKQHVSQRLIQEQYSELKLVLNYLSDLNATENDLVKILKWFRFLQTRETIGWRNKATTLKIARILLDSLYGKELQLYALFCPSYKKGVGEIGFRTDDIGYTSRSGLVNLDQFSLMTSELGFKQFTPLAIFFDLAFENAEELINTGLIGDIEKNIANFQKYVKPHIKFVRLSEYAPALIEKIGIAGTVIDPLPVPGEVFNRIVERGNKFYELFGWTHQKVIMRSQIIASSEAMVGTELREMIPNGIMLYTPTMLERAAVYSGFKYEIDPLAMIFPSTGP